MTPDQLEQYIAAVNARMDKHASLAIAAQVICDHHKAEYRALNVDLARLVAMRSPETVARMERERGLV